MYVRVCRSQRRTSGTFPWADFVFWQQDFFTEVELSNWLGWLIGEPPPVSSSQVLELQAFWFSFLFMCKRRSRVMFMWVPVEARRGHQVPRS